MAVTRIKNNQITDSTVNAAAKLQDYTITSGKIANNLTYGSDLTITGNLTVNGTTTTIDTVDLVVEDPLILLAKNQTGSPSLDIGFIGKRGTSDNIAFVWDENEDTFVTAFTDSEVTNTTINITAFADFKTLNANVTGNITVAGTADFTGNVSGGNLLTSGIVSATGNVEGGNINTGGVVSATGNVIGGNINTSGEVRAATGYFTGNVDVLGNLNASVGIVYANSGIFYGDAVTGNGAAYAGVPGFTPLGSNVVMQFGGNVNSYSQINFQNINSGTLASTDYIATADNGDDTNYYVDLGINSSTFNDPSYAGYGPNDSYVHNHGGNLILNPETTGTTIKLMVGGTESGNVVAEVSEAGVDVTGNISATGNITGGNLLTGGLISATGNVTGGNIITSGAIETASFSASGNITGGNLLTGGLVNATGNVTGGNVNTAGVLRGATLETTGNALIGGNLIVQGNITYINIDDLRVEDPIIILGTGPNGAPLTTDDGMDRGIFMEYYTSALGNAYMGWQNSSGNMLIASNVAFSGNNVVGINELGTLEVGNIYAESVVSVGNVTGGNLLTAGLISSTGNVTGGNLVTAGLVDSGSVTASTTVDATGNITGGNLLTGGLISATGNLDSGNVNTVLVAATTVSATGNVNGGNVNTGGLVSATGNVTGGNITTGGLVNATGNVTGGNITTGGLVVASGTVTGSSLLTGGVVSATGTITGGNLVTAGNGNIGNIRIAGDDITGTNGIVTFNDASADVDFRFEGNGDANLLFLDAGTDTVNIGTATAVTGAKLQIASTDSMIVPTGNTGQRPGSGTLGMFRFNTNDDALEVYTSAGWEAVGVPAFTVIADDQFTGDGSTVQFTLGQNSTTAATIVSINGVVQIPTTAYSVSGNVLTFTEAPLSTDTVDARTVTTTTTVTGIRNISGNAAVDVTDTAANVIVTGNLLPVANVTYDLGSDTERWNQLFLAGGTITLGNTVLKNTTGNSIGFFGPDGTTPATIDAASVDTTQIASGTSNMAVVSTNGNIRANVAGQTEMTISPGLVEITGNLSVTGNATLSGNILGDRIQNGTTTIDIQSAGGNANISVGGTTNVGVFATSGFYVSGLISATGNITGGNLSGTAIAGTLSTAAQTNITSVGTLTSLSVSGNVAAGNLSGTAIVGTLSTAAQTNITSVGTLTSLSVSGNIDGGNLRTAGLISATGTVTGTTFVGIANQAKYADLAEMYVSDTDYAPGTVLSFGGTEEVTLSATPADDRVAGVVSTNPSYLMNSALEGEYTVALALTGRVPTRVTGSVRKGDMMVSNGDGTARAESTPRIGTVIGKALEDFNGETGVIEVVIGRL